MDDETLVTVSEAFLKGVEKKAEGLNALMELSAILSSTLDLDSLISLFMEKTKNELDAQACSVLFYNKETDSLEFRGAICKDKGLLESLQARGTLETGQGITGTVAKTLQPLFLEDMPADSRFSQEADRFNGFRVESLIAVPLVGRSGLVGVAEILNPKKKDYDQDIVRLLGRQFAIAIENSLFYKEALERERLRQELDIASTIQKSFLPKSSTYRRGDLAISAVNIPAEEVGGDLYDFIEQKEDKVGILIGDVSGKGISAALYMAKFISDFRYVAHIADSPSLALNRVNLSLQESPLGMFISCIYLVVDIVTGGMYLSVAGHPPFLWITNGEVKVMSMQAGPPLGMIPAEYPLATISLAKGDRLLLLTDGVFDAKDGVGQRLGFENIVKFIKEHQNEKDLISAITNYIDDYSRGAERSDDVTIVELRWG